MGDEDSLYKREGDREWRDRVNGRLAHLTSGETVQNDRLDALHEKIEEHHEILEGDPKDREDNGLKGDVKEGLGRISRLESVLSIDITGNPGFDLSGKPGYLKKIDMLWGAEQRAERRWQNLVPIILAVIALVSANLERIEKWLKPTPQKPDRFHRMLERAKQPPGPRKKVIRYKYVPAPPSLDLENPDPRLSPEPPPN
jgi:hypothetical protein